jgi:type IV secretory pathway TrbD component/type IV secretory pathway VirB2 component (pilin)
MAEAHSSLASLEDSLSAFSAHADRRACASGGRLTLWYGFTAMQNLFTGTVAKVASLIAIVVGGYQFAHGEPGAKKALAGVAAGTGIAVLATNVLTWLWGIWRSAAPKAITPTSNQLQTWGARMQTHTTSRRRNRVYKSLHKPLTYLGVERTVFFFVCVAAVGAFNLFNSLLAGVAVFVGGFAFGSWVTNTDPAFLRILAKSEKYKARYDAAKQCVPRVEVQ